MPTARSSSTRRTRRPGARPSTSTARDSRTVRDFFVHNALYWVEEYRFDGLRMDAVHAIRDDSQPADRRGDLRRAARGPGPRPAGARGAGERPQRSPPAASATAMAGRWPRTAQWNDDLHHAAHVLLTRRDRRLLRRLRAAPAGAVRAARWRRASSTRASPRRFAAASRAASPATHLPLGAFVSFLQTHDQIGNRALGERIDALADPRALQAARACVLLSPHTPMLFMGEEFAASHAVPVLLRLRARAGGRGVGRPARGVRPLRRLCRRARARAAFPTRTATRPFCARSCAGDERDQAPPCRRRCGTRARAARTCARPSWCRASARGSRIASAGRARAMRCAWLAAGELTAPRAPLLHAWPTSACDRACVADRRAR